MRRHFLSATMLATLLAATLAVSAAAPALSEEPAGRVSQITVEQSSTREVVPDLAIISLSVVTQKKTAAEAASENAKAAQSVIDEIKRLGVEPRDIMTRDVTVTATFDETTDPKGNSTRKLTGYTARSALAVRLRQVDKVGAIASRLIDKGANEFDGIDFQVSDRDKQLDALRTEALKEAQRRAELYVQALGLKLGRVMTIDPGTSQAPPNLMARSFARKSVAAMESDSAAIPVEPGTQNVTATVTVTWELAGPR